MFSRYAGVTSNSDLTTRELWVGAEGIITFVAFILIIEIQVGLWPEGQNLILSSAFVNNEKGFLEGFTW